jgi:pilus assembly protein CpaD
MSKQPVKLVLLLGAVLIGLSACGGLPKEEVIPTPTSALEIDNWRDKIKVDGHADEIQLALHASGVSANQDQALRALVGRWLDAQGREIVVSAPLGGEDSSTSGRMASEVRERLIMVGAPAAQVRVVGYDAAGQTAAPLRVGYEYFVAERLQCGGWENLSATRKNEVHENFGCATAANLAAQVANPEDLIRPRDSSPIDAGRRDTVLGKYRRGEVSSSARDDQAKGTISKAIN